MDLSLVWLQDGNPEQFSLKHLAYAPTAARKTAAIVFTLVREAFAGKSHRACLRPDEHREVRDAHAIWDPDPAYSGVRACREECLSIRVRLPLPDVCEAGRRKHGLQFASLSSPFCCVNRTIKNYSYVVPRRITLRNLTNLCITKKIGRRAKVHGARRFNYG